jgi:hypothetical protein
MELSNRLFDLVAGPLFGRQPLERSAQRQVEKQDVENFPKIILIMHVYWWLTRFQLAAMDRRKGQQRSTSQLGSPDRIGLQILVSS